MVPRSNRHGRKRPYTKKYDDLHVTVLRSYISVSYTEENDRITAVYERIQTPYSSTWVAIITFTEYSITINTTISIMTNNTLRKLMTLEIILTKSNCVGRS